MHLISRRIPVEFREPPFTTAGRSRTVFTTLMPMPEAAVDEDGGFVFRQDDVGADEEG